jgi:predicted enzyme related to lactoylglutathione lyase
MDPVVFFEVIGKDAKQLQAFYADLFGWKIDTNNPLDYGMVDPSGSGIAGGIGAGGDMPHPGVTFYVQVEDTDAYLKKAESLGGKVIVPTTTMPGVTFALIADPEGNVVGVAKDEGYRKG